MRSIEHSFEVRPRVPAGTACTVGGPVGAVRLTHRGRVVFVLALLALLVTAGLTVGRATVRAAGPSKPLPTVTVHPGETLWQIAARVAPHSDRRLLVREIEDLNGLGDGRVVAGQQLRLPR